MICILDYGSGNVRSVANLLTTIHSDVRISNEASVICAASHLILPGVGAFGAAMEKIRRFIPIEILRQQVFHAKKPFLGICVGMQVLAEKGFEFGEHEGLGWVPGTVEKLSSAQLPHMGWNSLRICRENPLLQHFSQTQDFYFVHSYAFRPTDPAHIVATTDYDGEFVSLVSRENIHGAQFHPEKSQKAGIQFIKNFLDLS